LYLYRAIDSSGDTVEFWFSERRNLAPAKLFLRKALKHHGRPERMVIDGSQTNREAILSCDAESRLQDRSRRRLKPIRIRQSQYLNNRIEQDHRVVKRRVRPMLGFKSADSARVILSGIELIHMMRKQQAKYACDLQLSLAEQFHLLAP
jgi:putative transposase